MAAARQPLIHCFLSSSSTSVAALSCPQPCSPAPLPALTVTPVVCIVPRLPLGICLHRPPCVPLFLIHLRAMGPSFPRTRCRSTSRPRPFCLHAPPPTPGPLSSPSRSPAPSTCPLPRLPCSHGLPCLLRTPASRTCHLLSWKFLLGFLASLMLSL